jgi:hypothetical protein
LPGLELGRGDHEPIDRSEWRGGRLTCHPRQTTQSVREAQGSQFTSPRNAHSKPGTRPLRYGSTSYTRRRASAGTAIWVRFNRRPERRGTSAPIVRAADRIDGKLGRTRCNGRVSSNP